LQTRLLARVASYNTAPIVNRVQTVSKDDYEAVRAMWKENYTKLEVPQGMAGSRSEWMKDDIGKIDKIVGLLSSTDKEKVQQGMDEVSNILPFLMMGGFSQTEIYRLSESKTRSSQRCGYCHCSR